VYFEIVKRLIGLSIQEIAESRNLSSKEALQIASSYLHTMSTEWFRGNAPTIAYDDPLCRWAYIFRHVAVHANCLESVLQKCELESEDFAKTMQQQDELSILTFGGGPGTELMALAKHFAILAEKTNWDQVDVEFTIVDRVNAWSENINSLRAEINRFYKREFGAPSKWPARFNVFTYALDLTNIHSFGNLPSLFKKKHLFIFNFMISETFSLNKLKPLLRTMKKSCADGTFFLFVDRKDDNTKSTIDELIHAVRLDVVVEGEDRRFDTVDGDEQKSILSLVSKHLKRDPRHTWNSCWRLAVK